MTEVQGGTRANYTGRILEKFIEDRLKERGYTFIDKRKFKPSIYIGQPIYSKQFFLGQNLYNTNTYCDFVLYHPEKWNDCLVIESKWQESGGSVDEKYPFLILNIQMRYPHKTILVIDGGGYKQGALEWIKGQVGNNLLAVMNMQEFNKWVNQENL